MADRTETVALEYRVRLAELKAELDQMPKMSKKATNEIVRDWQTKWKAAEKAGKDATVNMSKETAKLGKVAELVGGQWGTSLRGVKGVMELVEGGVNSTTLALGGLGIAGGAGVVAVGALGAVIANTLGNIDSMAASLTQLDREALEPQIASVVAARHEQDRLSQSWTAAQIAITSKYAPALRDLYTILAYAVDPTATLTAEQQAQVDVVQQLADKVASGALSYADLAAQTDDTMERQVKMRVSGMETAQMWDGLTSSAHAYATELRALADDEQARIDRAAKNPHGGLSMTGNAMAEMLGMPTGIAVSQAPPKASSTTTNHASNRPPVSATMQAAFDANMQAQAVLDELDTQIADKLAALGQAGVDDLMAEAQAAQNASAIILQAKRDEVDGTKAANAEIAEANRALTQKRMQDAATFLSMSASVLGSIGDLTDNLMQREIDATKEGSEARREAMRKQFIAHKAMAIATATIDTAAAVVSALATSGNIYAGIAMSVAAGVAGTAEIAMIAAEKMPTAHTGGVPGNNMPNAPDEVNIRALRTEGVVSPQGMAALARLNRGEGMGGGQVIAVPFYGHRMYDAVTGGALARRGSSLSKALRSVRTTRAGHRLAA